VVTAATVAVEDEEERRVRLLLLGKAAVLAHQYERPLAAEMDESEQRQTRGAGTCWLFLSTDAGVSARTQLTPARDEDQVSASVGFAPVSLPDSSRTSGGTGAIESHATHRRRAPAVRSSWHVGRWPDRRERHLLATAQLCPLLCPRAQVFGSVEPKRCGIIIRVSGVRVPPPASEVPANRCFLRNSGAAESFRESPAARRSIWRSHVVSCSPR